MARIVDGCTAWVERQDPASRRGATVGWFRLYRRADGPLFAMVFTAYLFITLIPAIVVLASSIYGDPAVLAERLAERLDLGPSTVALLKGVLVGASSHKFVSSMLALVNIILFGGGFGRTLQLVHARVWRIDVSMSRLRDQERYLIVLTVLVALVTLYLVQTAATGATTTVGLLFAPVWVIALIGYFLMVPWLLLHGRIPASDLVPGALFVAAALVVLRLASRIVLARWLTSYSENYGGFGIVLALFLWLFVLGTAVVIGAALAPPLSHRRTLRVDGGATLAAAGRR